MKRQLILIISLSCMVAFSASTGNPANNPMNLARLKLEELNKTQMQHLEIYRQIKVMKYNNQYSPEKCFEPRYRPFVNFIVQLEPLVIKEAQSYEEKANQFFTEGRNDLQAVALKHMNMCKVLVQLCQDVKNAYYDKNLHGKMGGYMRKYADYEFAMSSAGIKMPRRDWLTQTEAELLIRRYYRNLAAQKARPRQ